MYPVQSSICLASRSLLHCYKNKLLLIWMSKLVQKHQQHSLPIIKYDQELYLLLIPLWHPYLALNFRPGEMRALSGFQPSVSPFGFGAPWSSLWPIKTSHPSQIFYFSPSFLLISDCLAPSFISPASFSWPLLIAASNYARDILLDS